MAKYDYKILIELDHLVDSLEEKKICKMASDLLIENLKKNTNNMFDKHKSGYPYMYHGSFNNDSTYRYISSENVVEIVHPAAKRLEYGLEKDLEFDAKKGTYMKFVGKDGDDVYLTHVKIEKESCPPMGYAAKSVKETQSQIYENLKGMING